MRTQSTTLVALGLALALGGAVASPGEYDGYYARRGPMPFEVLDRNRDGVVSKQEHAAVRAERQAYRGEHGYRLRNADAGGRLMNADADGDGVVSQQEFSDWRATATPCGPMGRGYRW